MTLHDLPLLNAILNSLTALLLLAGWIQIKRGNKEAHKKIMVTAFCVSSVFLASYLLHKFTVGPKLFPMQGWVRVLYFFILIPHTILAVVNLPFILAVVWFAATGQFEADPLGLARLDVCVGHRCAGLLDALSLVCLIAERIKALCVLASLSQQGKVSLWKRHKTIWARHPLT